MVCGAEPEDACLNCGVERVGRFCPACGQRYVDEPMTLRSLLRAFSSRVFDLDQGLLYTIRRLAIDPGGVSREYVKGRQKPYVHPLALLVVASAGIMGIVGITESTTRSILMQVGADALFRDNEAVLTWMYGMLEAYVTLLFIASAIPIAYAFYRAFRRIATYTFTETLVMVLYATAQATLYTAVCQFVVLLYPTLAGLLFAQASSLLLFPVLAHASYGFYRREKHDVLIGLFASLVAYVVPVAVVGAIAFAVGTMMP